MAVVQSSRTSRCSSEEKSEDALVGLAPKGSSLLHGLVLFQSRTTVKIVLDQRESGEVRSQTLQNRLFQQRDYGFGFLGPCGRRYGAFAGPRVPPLIGRRPHGTPNSERV